MTAVSMWFVHTVQVATITGNGFKGDTWTSPVDVACWVEDSVDDIRTNEGDQTTSTARLYAPLAQRSAFTVGSQVTLPSGRTAQVLQVHVFDSGSLGLGLDHIQVDLT